MEASPKREKTKGKQIMEEEFDEEEEEGEGEISSESGGSDPTAEIRCGICLSDVGGSIRGHIDSCEHNFCFVCIMEWSKVETRCPMCKQRFRSIRRPATPGIFIHERVVDVPERNQFYNGLGNASQTLSDPYANITCCECLSCRDEELLLLCDLCDSASHTYCAGLGATVPEGDWYCRDCTKIKTEHSKEEADSKVCNHDSYNSLRAVRSSLDPVSIFEIISDGVVSVQEFANEHDDPEQETEQEPRGNTSRGDSEDHAVSNRARGEQHVRTLRHCRNLQDRIRQIRENWNFLRSGSVTFSSTINKSSNRNTNSKRKNRTNSGISRKLEPVFSATSKQPADSSVTPKIRHSALAQDEGKTWKMMKIAKSIDGTRKGSVPNHSSTSFSKNIISKDVRNQNSGPVVAKGYSALHGLPGHTTSKAVDKQHKFRSLEKEIPQSRKTQAEKEMGHSHRGPTKVLQSNNLKPSYKPAGSSEEGICCLKKPILQQVADENLTLSKGHDACDYRGSAICSVSEPSTTIEIKPIAPSSSIVNSEGKSHGVITSIDKSSITRNAIINCGSKDEIQSLVKLNLKLESKHELLDADTFKEVARAATHTILAACGLEYSKSCAQAISQPQCTHSEQIKYLHRSNLMPNSCRECFYSFVKHVVNSIFVEKIARRTHTN